LRGNIFPEKEEEKLLLPGSLIQQVKGSTAGKKLNSYTKMNLI